MFLKLKYYPRLVGVVFLVYLLSGANLMGENVEKDKFFDIFQVLKFTWDY